MIKRVLRFIKENRDPVKYAQSIGVKIHDNVRITGTIGWGSEPWLISVDEGTNLTNRVVFLTHDGSVNQVRRLDEKYRNVVKFGRIDIGKNCFIGAYSTIMPDVIIGDNCVIAAGSIVTHDIPSGEVWGGVPAKKMCSIEEYAEKLLKETPDYDPERIKTHEREETLKIANARRELRRKK